MARVEFGQLLATKRLNLSSSEQKFAGQKLENGASPDQFLNPNFWKGRRRLHLTAVHEIGHATVARMNGWFVTAISVIPEGNTLGWTKSVPGKINSVYNFLREKIALCYGGMMAEQKAGHGDHSGCGSDMGQANYAARQLSMFYGGSQSQYLAEGRSNANKSLNLINFSDLTNQAEHLAEIGIAA